jgi:hypothetical protein
MGFKMKGSDNLKRLLKDVEKKAKKASGAVSISELLNQEFMQANTKFKNLDEFFEKSPFEIENQADLKQVNEKELDQYVKDVTAFTSWEEMLSKAGALYMKKKIGL